MMDRYIESTKGGDKAIPKHAEILGIEEGFDVFATSGLINKTENPDGTVEYRTKNGMLLRFEDVVAFDKARKDRNRQIDRVEARIHGQMPVGLIHKFSEHDLDAIDKAIADPGKRGEMLRLWQLLQDYDASSSHTEH